MDIFYKIQVVSENVHKFLINLFYNCNELQHNKIYKNWQI